jgi:hypothetical protein
MFSGCSHRTLGKGWLMGGQRQEKNNLDDSAVLESITSQWWSFSSFVPLVTGALWLWLAASSDLPAVLLGAVPGSLLLGTGLSGLLWAVEARTFQYMALASALGGSSRCAPSSPASSTGWCRRSRPTASGDTGKSRASPGTREPTSALYAHPKAVRSSKRPSVQPACFPRRHQALPLNDRRSWRSRPGSKSLPTRHLMKACSRDPGLL